MSDYDTWKLESREDEEARITRELGPYPYEDDAPKPGDIDHCPHRKWHPMACATCAPGFWKWHQDYYGYPDEDRPKYQTPVPEEE